jgi:hypothetical protein
LAKAKISHPIDRHVGSRLRMRRIMVESMNWRSWDKKASHAEQDCLDCSGGDWGDRADFLSTSNKA